MNCELVERLSQVERNFRNTKYAEKVKQALNCYYVGDYSNLEKILQEFPQKQQLLEELLEKLKGKPVYKTLKRIGGGRTKSHWEGLKGLFSLGTHTCVELEKGNLEYQMLLRDIFEKIGALLFESQGEEVWVV